MDDIQNNINLPWRWYNISFNPNLTMKFLNKYLNKNWDWEFILQKNLFDIEKQKYINDNFSLLNCCKDWLI